MQELDPTAAQSLLGVTKEILYGAHMLLEYVDHNREEAQAAGVETIGIELSAILEGGKIEDIKDALEEAARTGERPQISLDGFAKLRRAERLVSDAEISLGRFTGGQMPSGFPQRKAMASPKISAPVCAHCTSHNHGSLGASSSFPASTVVLGILGMGVALTLIILAVRKP